MLPRKWQLRKSLKHKVADKDNDICCAPTPVRVRHIITVGTAKVYIEADTEAEVNSICQLLKKWYENCPPLNR